MKRVLSFLKWLWSGWLRFAKWLGFWQARIILFVIYMVMVSWLALLVRRFSDPLGLRLNKASSWFLREDAPPHSKQATRQY